ncbi:uncharacterized protein LOC105891842 isoform X5 [Clupea harengus]|uniref:Uncharacterized protein LOC105891842 isoform X5 n=1 Tax=Clupea harengus TaxID=7950 RepID=A0A6P8G953_CLUHA|nr:uncharacterized protein LOC105891842 isoform X5 [Clupea harengus]
MNSEGHQMCLIRSEEEARVIEIAVRTAVLSVVEVINDINKTRLHEYQKEVAEKDKENAHLKAEVNKAVKELAFLRQLVGFREQGERSVRNASTGTQVSGNKLSVETSCCVEDGTVNKGVTTVQSSVKQSKSHSIDIQIECSSEETTAVQDDSAAGSSNPNGHFCAPSEYSEDYTDFTAAVNFPVVKEEPPSRDSVYIKFEVKEENPCTDQDDDSSPSCLLEREPLENYHFHHHRDSTFGTRTIKRCDDRERQRRYRERIRADPEKQQAYLERDRLRYQQRKKLICDLPEQIQTQKRAAWREAARRSRAKKKSHPTDWPEPL